MHPREIDLNLLRTLGALIEERSVTRVAERLGVTQPAVSASLARLRVLLDDPLLVRGAGGMVPTARARQLSEPLRQIMKAAEEIVSTSSAFNPLTSRRSFVLIGTDFVEFAVLPQLLAGLATEAPGLQLLFRPSNPLNLERLMAEGEIDLGIGYLPDAPSSLKQRALFSDRFVCIARRGSPHITEQSLTVEQFAALDHVQVLPRDTAVYSTPIDEALGKLDLTRRVLLWQPSFLAVPFAVAASNAIATLPRRLATTFATLLPLTVFDVPLTLPPIDLTLYWHATAALDPAHQWLRDFVVRNSRGR